MGRLPLVGSLADRAGAALARSLRRANVAMFHAGRCGSTVLADLLGQHPKVFWAGELFEGRPGQADGAAFGATRDGVRSHLWGSMYATRRPYYGFETKFLPEQHLRPDVIPMSLGVYVAFLRELGFSRFISLRRRNYLRRVVSAAVGFQNKQWHAREQTGAVTRIHLDLDHVRISRATSPLLDHFRSLDAAYRTLHELLADVPLLTLVYEDDVLADPTVGYRKACGFLGIDPAAAAVDVHFARTNPFPLPEIVANYQEVAALLGGTEYAWMLAD